MTINIPLTPNRAKKVVFSVSTGRSVGHVNIFNMDVPVKELLTAIAEVSTEDDHKDWKERTAK